MKATTLVAAAMIMTAGAYASEPGYFGNADSYSSKNPTAAVEAYVPALGSGNDGVIESALANIAAIALASPNADFTPVMRSVEWIERTSHSDELKYKAFVTRKVLENPAPLTTVNATKCSTPDELFGGLASRMGEYYAAK